MHSAVYQHCTNKHPEVYETFQDMLLLCHRDLCKKSCPKYWILVPGSLKLVFLRELGKEIHRTILINKYNCTSDANKPLIQPRLRR